MQTLGIKRCMFLNPADGLIDHGNSNLNFLLSPFARELGLARQVRRPLLSRVSLIIIHNHPDSGAYRNNRGLRTLCGRLFKCFHSQIFIPQGCGDANMCEVTDTCAEIELSNLVLKNNAHPCAMTPVCVILNKTKRRYGFVAERGGVWFLCHERRTT